MKKDNKIYGFISELNPITKLILVLSLGIGCMIYPSSFLGYYLLVIILILSFFMGTGRKVSLLILGFGIPVTLMLLFIQGLYSPKNTIIIADLGFASLGLEGTMYALKISSTLLVFLTTFYLFLNSTKKFRNSCGINSIGSKYENRLSYFG